MQDKNPKSLFGIDINEYTQNVDFKVLATKIDFLYLRSSGSGSGRLRVDKKFLDFANKSRLFGIPVGAYHFGLPSYDLNTADSQCDDFIQVLQSGFGNKDYGDLFPALDIEAPTGNKKITVTALVNWIDRFRKRFERKTRRRLILYTGTDFIELYNDFKVPNKGSPLKNMLLWIAMYTKIQGNPPFPKNQGGWTKWRIWQFSEDLTISGVGNPVDANWGPNNISLLMQPENIKSITAKYEGNNIVIKWTPVSDIDLLGYNIFINNYWVGTVDEKDTEFVLNKRDLPVASTVPLTVSIEAFDYDGEVSKKRAKFKL